MNKAEKLSGIRKKPGPKRVDFDYAEVAFHCRAQISDAHLARKLKMSPQLLAYHLKKDPKLQEARDGGTWDGQNIVSDAMFRKMLDRYMTVCKDCHKIRFSFDQFYESCPYCDQTEPELAGSHTNVSHKFITGDTNVMLAWGKTYLGLTDRVTHEGNEDKPLVFSTLADYALARAEARKQKDAKTKEKATCAAKPDG